MAELIGAHPLEIIFTSGGTESVPLIAGLADLPDPSHVIAAMKPGSAAPQSIRFSLGAENTADEIRDAAAALGGVR